MLHKLFSNRARENGIISAIASQWLFNLVVTISTPYMIDRTLSGSAFRCSTLFTWYLAEAQGRIRIACVPKNPFEESDDEEDSDKYIQWGIY